MARLALGVCLLLLPASCRGARDREAAEAPRPERGAVVAEHPLAVEAGLAILDRGGNAADAAVATALALAVVYPQAGNLGGGGFALWVPREGAPTSLDFRETAPAVVDPAWYLDEEGHVDPDRSRRSPMAVGVPGTPAGLEELHRRHGSGRLTFAELCAPALRLAREGFVVDDWLARSLEEAAELLSRDPAAARLFLPGGRPLAEGALWVQEDLARALELLAERGAQEGFYRGPVAEALVASLEEARERTGVRGAGPDRQDLTGYRVAWREPLVGAFLGHEVIGMGPPSSGGLVLLQVLSVLEGMPLRAEREADGGPTPRALHWWIEALRRAFADRATHMGDPDHHPVPVEQLLSPTWIARRRISIGEHADPDVLPWAPDPGPESGETTHLSVLDAEGNAVSLTTTLNASYGSGLVVEGFGFLLNNELDDFSILAGTPNMFGLVGAEANQLRPLRRPLSSMTPTVVRAEDGGVRLVVGAPGGPRIITAVFQVVVRVLAHGQGLEQAVSAPRLHQQWRPRVTRLERGFGEETLRALREVHGQPLEEAGNATFASVQAIEVGAGGEVRAVSDPRRGGVGGLQGRPLPAPRPAGTAWR